ncbi:MAG: hypothetical protein A2161_12850 [Candidatus Schekmanbacteria bacterium RBG_13_48_7]|uniref:Radical SAM core domain-containing protein n=1 Tax=Candidatus Schekmanbacteria bacterium RBG_13_48_7 TaxID=1817878 RepID=A0A1F7S2U2_9BACT|nr:MAG: hypothetical protein A2161_12850 [Candidatus Schekmanbacteria bacterium RBG_13_48_7]
MKLKNHRDWKERIRAARRILESCCLCGHRCGVNRIENETGFCQCGSSIKISHYLPHFGEEPPITGKKGSGAVFFSGCTMQCVFCQNYQISQLGFGHEVYVEELVNIILELQSRGCHNINLVSPTPYVPMIIESLYIAQCSGFKLPVVYNTNGYDSLDTLELLKGIVDIYLPDFKYGDDAEAVRLSKINNYFETCTAGLVEMYSQAGSLRCDLEGLGEGGLIVRHLVLPLNLAKSNAILQTLAKLFGSRLCISLLSQYRPVFNAHQFSEINRIIIKEEYDALVDEIDQLGFEICWIQLNDCDESFLPDFSKNKPFKFE